MAKKINLLESLGIPPLPSHSPDTIAAIMWAREVMQRHLKITYGVNDPKGIEELKALKIGGVDQWLHIRGRNRNNPVLLYLHGGPGSSMIGWMDATMRPWEDYFTIVHWDQRQTGKSYYPADDENNPLTINQFIEDTEEVIQYLHSYLKQKKIFVLGHSWGSVLGMHIVNRHPEWLHAYIGIGQVVNLTDNEKLIYERLLMHAKAQNNEQLLAKLKAISPYPDPSNLGKAMADHSGFLRTELGRLSGGAYETNMRYLSLDELVEMISLDRTISPHLTLTDISNGIIGGEKVMSRPPYIFAEQFMNTDLPNDVGSSFDVPIFFFTGAHDWHTPFVLSDKWFEKIKAPYKELVKFKDSSHFVINEEPGKVLITLVNKVYPFANRSATEGKT